MVGYNLQIEHTPIIVEIVKLLGCETYLELGVLQGETIHEVVPYSKRCIGVDIADIRKYRDFEFYQVSTDVFFSIFKGKADVIFIDADHSFESIQKDIKNSLRILSKHGIILLHDVDPISNEYLKPELCNDSYKAVNWIKVEFPQLNIVVLPISVAGLAIVNRDIERRINDFI